jgi:site-specific recombinase XerD
MQCQQAVQPMDILFQSDLKVKLITRKVYKMKQHFKFLFFLKKGKGSKSGILPIYARITIDGQRIEWSIQRSCLPGRWNRQTGRAIGTKTESSELNAYLDVIQNSIYDIQKEFALKKELLTAGIIKTRILNKSEEKKQTILDVYRYHNEQFEKMVGVQYSYGTFKKFKSALYSLKKFVLWKYKKPDVELNEINHQFIKDYEFYLKAIQGVQHNSAMGNIKKLKKIVRHCVANEWITNDPFKSYRITTEETFRNFLLMRELQNIISKPLSITRLDQVRDIFVFSCYTGLCYSDVIDLKASDICIGIDGEKWIVTKRKKTDTLSRIPLLPIAIGLLSKYSNHPAAVSAGKLFPPISNQRLNSYLKEISVICGINKELTFHCARHTFATTVTLTNGVPIETVSKMLGHRSLRTTQQYAKILDSKISDDMKELKKKLIQLNGCSDS